MNLIFASIFGILAGVWLIYRGKHAIKTKYMANSLKSQLLTGISGFSGQKAVTAGRISVVAGYVGIVFSSLLLLLSVAYQAYRYLPRMGIGSLAKGIPLSERTETLGSSREDAAEKVTRDMEEKHEARMAKLESDRIRQEEEIKASQEQSRRAQEAAERKSEEARALAEKAFEESRNKFGTNLNSNPAKPNRNRSPFPNSMDQNPDDIETDAVTLPVPSVSLPAIRYDTKSMTKTNWVGNPLSSNPTEDDIQSGRILVGLIVGQGRQFGGAVQILQAVYQIGKEYELGKSMGPDGGKKTLLLAPPGHVVSGISIKTGTQIGSIQLAFQKMTEKGILVKNSMTQSEVVGVDIGVVANTYADGNAIGSIYTGMVQTSLSAIGLFAIKKFKLEESKLRQWTSANGKTVKAEFVEKKDASVVLKREDGKVITVKLSDLSEDDRAWVKDQN